MNYFVDTDKWILKFIYKVKLEEPTQYELEQSWRTHATQFQDLLESYKRQGRTGK